ncbi:MAG: precorrin-2 dehydrogenase/sirohydrochlorin ferrochelatase family protein [Leptospirales bacterium]
MHRYPVYLDLSSRPVLVVGGGLVALRKMPALLATGARVSLISPSLVPELRQLSEAGRFVWIPRRYVEGDEQGFSLVLALTDRPEVNRRISERSTCFVNQATPSEGNPAALPHVSRRDPLVLSVGSDPPDPLLVREVGEHLTELLRLAGVSEYALEHTLLRQLLLEDGRYSRPEIRKVLEEFNLDWALNHPGRAERLSGYGNRLGPDIPGALFELIRSREESSRCI